MDIYEELGVRTLINAAGAMSRYGGSLVDPGVYDAMREAGGKFCMLDELHQKVGERIAGLLEVEAAYVTASAASGLVLTTAACMAGTDPERIARLPDSSGMRSEVVIQRLHRIGYDQAIRLAGATLVVVEDDGEPPLAAMREAVGDDTAAIFCMAHRLEEPGSLRIEDYVALSRESGVPLVVDAASECPPLSTLTRFSREGADLVIFSGGKSLLGPQSTGLVVGRGGLIAACAANGNPFATVGRPMKVSSEEVIGFLKALESYLARDHEADRARWQAQVRRVEEESGRTSRDRAAAPDQVPDLRRPPARGAALARGGVHPGRHLRRPGGGGAEGHGLGGVRRRPRRHQPAHAGTGPGGGRRVPLRRGDPAAGTAGVVGGPNFTAAISRRLYLREQGDPEASRCRNKVRIAAAGCRYPGLGRRSPYLDMRYRSFSGCMPNRRAAPRSP